MRMRTMMGGAWRAIGMAAALGASVLPACSPRAAEPAAGPAPAPEAGPAATAGRAAGSPTASEAPPTAAPGGSGSGSPAHGAGGGDSVAEARPAAPPDSQYLSYDPATKTVTFRLVAGPFSWNGYTGGNATLTVPPGTTNVMNFEQADGTPHSAEIASGTGPVPNSGGDPAIPRAYTNKVVEGLPQGATDVMRFTAPDSGSYRIICGVPGHALSGMWIWYTVDPAATKPSFGPTPR